MEAVVASMQVQYLTSLMHAHLNRLCALREQQKARFTSPSTRYARLCFGILLFKIDTTSLFCCVLVLPRQRQRQC